MTTRQKVLGVAVVALVLMATGAAQAHGGRTDSSGCHTNRRTGSYHCHNGGSSSSSKWGSGWAKPKATPPTPKAPPPKPEPPPKPVTWQDDWDAHREGWVKEEAHEAAKDRISKVLPRHRRKAVAIERARLHVAHARHNAGRVVKIELKRQQRREEIEAERVQAERDRQDAEALTLIVLGGLVALVVLIVVAFVGFGIWSRKRHKKKWREELDGPIADLVINGALSPREGYRRQRWADGVRKEFSEELARAIIGGALSVEGARQKLANAEAEARRKAAYEVLKGEVGVELADALVAGHITQDAAKAIAEGDMEEELRGQAIRECWSGRLVRAALEGLLSAEVASKVSFKTVEAGLPPLAIELMFGTPDKIGEKVMKTKTRHTWTYYTKTGRKKILRRFRFVDEQLEEWELN